MTNEELAWAAGLFEGEGTIRINAPTKRNLTCPEAQSFRRRRRSA